MSFALSRTSALLVMDYQADVLSLMAPEPGPVLAAARRAIDAAHSAGLPVIYVVVGFRPGYPELNPQNERLRGAIRARGGFVIEDPRAAVHPDLAPADGDIVVTKRRMSAFSGSDLDIVLRSRGIDTLMMMGVSTSGVVLSTTRQAFDLDYRLVVVADGCTDPDPEVHRVLVEKILARQAMVVSSTELEAAAASLG